MFVRNRYIPKIQLILFLLLPVISTISTYYFGTIFTKSPNAGFHHYGELSDMLPYAFIQAPFCCFLAFLSRSLFNGNIVISRNVSLAMAAIYGAIIALVSGLITSAMVTFFAFETQSLDIEFSTMLFLNYFSYYFDFGFSIAAGMLVGVICRDVSINAENK